MKVSTTVAPCHVERTSINEEKTLNSTLLGSIIIYVKKELLLKFRLYIQDEDEDAIEQQKRIE